MMDSFQVRKQLRYQKIEEVTFTPTSAGQYRFYCPINGMEGTLLVKEATPRGPANLQANYESFKHEEAPAEAQGE